MKEERVSDALLRQFLLGTTDEEERDRIEGMFLTDSNLRDRVLAAEQDLIEDYLENSLTTADKERFLKLHAQTPAQQQKLRITKSIKDWAVSEAVKTETGSSAASVSDKVRKRPWLRPSFALPIAAAIVIAIVLPMVWVSLRNQQQNHLAIEQELAQLNSPSSLREVPPQMVLQELRPVAVRSVEAQTELKRSAETQLVELRLPWIQKERYPTYRAEIRQIDDDEAFTISNLQAANDSGYAIRLRLRPHFLNRGHYQIHVTGIGADGSPGRTEQYSFAVAD